MAPAPAALGSGGVRDPRAHRRERRVRPADFARRPARREHPPSTGPAGLDGRRSPAAPPGDRPGRARSPVAHHLRRPRVSGGGSRLGADRGDHRGPARARRWLLRGPHRLDDHDLDQRDADVSFVLLALSVIAVLGPSLPNMILVLGVAGWPIYARVIRAETMAIREREFVLAGRALGMSHARIVFRQIAPNLVSVIVVIATLQVAQVIIFESFLSFLGLGIQPPTPAWGNMLGEGRVYMLNSWWIATFPGLAIFLTTLVINLMGNALRDWLDPHLKL